MMRIGEFFKEKRCIEVLESIGFGISRTKTWNVTLENFFRRNEFMLKIDSLSMAVFAF